MLIKKVVVGELSENCYIVVNNEHALIVDPGSNYYKIKQELGDYTLDGILITHHHYDHIGALEELVKENNVKVYEYPKLEEQEYILSNFKFRVIFTPGHTTDSVSYYFLDTKDMFVGDFIFANTIGRTDLKTGSIHDMRNSIRLIKEYDDAIKIYPGHGETTNLKVEKRTNYFFGI